MIMDPSQLFPIHVCNIGDRVIAIKGRRMIISCDQNVMLKACVIKYYGHINSFTFRLSAHYLDVSKLK